MSQRSQPDRIKGIATALFLVAFFLTFTWRGIFVYFSGDDVTNLYRAWKPPLTALIKANLFFWSPYYRPWGGAVYRAMFAVFGFHPRPLAALYYVVLLFNLWLAYAVFRRLSRSDEIGLLATLLFSVHARLDYLYYNLGVLYDVFCSTFFLATLLLYLRIREAGRYPGWRAFAGPLALFICCLNSKEMGAALPPILLLYEIIFHRPQGWRPRTLFRWLTHEARTAVLLSLLLIPYAAGKLAPEGLVSSPAYVPHVSAGVWLETTRQYLAYLLYSPRPLTRDEVLLFYGLLAVLAAAMRSRLLWFGMMFFVITLLPVSFVATRLGFVLYLPLAGLAFYAAVVLVQAKEKLISWRPLRALTPHGGLLLLLLTAASLAVAHARHWNTARDPSPVRITASQFSGRLHDIHPGSRLLFVKDAFGGSYELLYTLSLLYRQRELEVTQLEGRPDREIAADIREKYDHIFTYERGRYLEMDHADTARALQLNLLLDKKTGKPAGGEMLVVGHPDQYAYYISDVLIGDPNADSYWTGASPQLKFTLNTAEDHFFAVRFYLPRQTFEKTGPVTVSYFINGHLLGRVRYESPGEQSYRCRVPRSWIEREAFTFVRMEVANPYIAPADGARLGFLLRSAGFESAIQSQPSASRMRQPSPPSS